jgi:hypothetical protein
MPIGFLTVEQRRSHGCFNAEPTAEQLARYFHLDDSDRATIGKHRGDHNRLGFAVQLCTARFLGTFLENLSETPKGVIAFVGRQLHISNLTAFDDYCHAVTRKAHTVELRRRYGFRDFSDLSARFRLNRWLYALCWTGTDRPGMLFDRAVAWLITHKVLLPGATVLERQVARIRNRAQERVWSLLTHGISAKRRPSSKLFCGSLIAEPRHQLGVGGGAPPMCPAGAAERPGKSMAGNGRNHEVECVRRLSAMGPRIGERSDEIEEFDKRAGPTMNQQ